MDLRMRSHDFQRTSPISVNRNSCIRKLEYILAFHHLSTLGLTGSRVISPWNIRTHMSFTSIIMTVDDLAKKATGVSVTVIISKYVSRVSPISYIQRGTWYRKHNVVLLPVMIFFNNFYKQRSLFSIDLNSFWNKYMKWRIMMLREQPAFHCIQHVCVCRWVD